MRDIGPDLGARGEATQEAFGLLAHRARPVQPIEIRLSATPPATRLLPEEIGFLTRYGFAPEGLGPIVARARRLGLSPVATLIASGVITEAAFVRLFAHHLGACTAEGAVPDARVTLGDGLRQGWFRARLGDGRTVLVVDVTGAAARAMMTGAMRHHRAHLAFAGRSQFEDLLRRHFAGEIALRASCSVPQALSARTGMTGRQIAATSAAGLVLAAAFIAAPALTITLLPLLLGLFFLGSAILQLAATVEGYAQEPTGRAGDDAQLPAYSVLVPLYREAGIVPDLVAALSALDYPQERLQILLVVEEHDSTTIEAIRAEKLPPNITLFQAPAGTPHTKPRAINAAMEFVTGDFVVVYDAEDRPDPGQLRAAVARFDTVDAAVVCLQARLAIDNTFDSWITRFFTIEYAALFDVVKAGTARLGLPVPLGGTSNHFRTQMLRDVGLWDAWNVTEDADLGLRLAIHGLGVEDLNSSTYEEAPNRIGPWMHQRSRWLKGWMQTIISHSRTPIRVWRAMGTLNFACAVAQSAGVIIGAMGAPLFHALVILRLMAPEPFGSGDGLNRLADSVIIILGIAGILAVYVPAIIGVYRRRLWSLTGWVVLLPLYQLLVSVAAYKAFWELIRSPHSWNKTQHGVARTQRRQIAGQGGNLEQR